MKALAFALFIFDINFPKLESMPFSCLFAIICEVKPININVLKCNISISLHHRIFIIMAMIIRIIVIIVIIVFIMIVIVIIIIITILINNGKLPMVHQLFFSLQHQVAFLDKHLSNFLQCSQHGTSQLEITTKPYLCFVLCLINHLLLSFVMNLSLECVLFTPRTLIISN